MRSSDRTRLLFGPYRPPRLGKGDRAAGLCGTCGVAAEVRVECGGPAGD